MIERQLTELGQNVVADESAVVLGVIHASLSSYCQITLLTINCRHCQSACQQTQTCQHSVQCKEMYELYKQKIDLVSNSL